jgi:hypothetical protein
VGEQCGKPCLESLAELLERTLQRGHASDRDPHGVIAHAADDGADAIQLGGVAGDEEGGAERFAEEKLVGRWALGVGRWTLGVGRS